ncbi:MAG: Rrf2 family transcriptional regulator [Gammaproteobacteria bacterium]|nr:Rrf2 family transcriptional regulator [Gammaproteobacteria bacterium]
MQLTMYTDYSLRVLIYLGLRRDRLSTVSEIAQSYGISRNHLVKVVHNLSTLGFIVATRGKGGGLSLAHPPERIAIGDVVRHTEANFNVVECFDKKNKACPITPVCRLKSVLGDAADAFLRVLDGYTLADMLKNEQKLSIALRIIKR